MLPSSPKRSNLQQLVRAQRKLIVEPVLESSAAFLATFTDSEEEDSPLVAGKAGARNGRKSKKKARDQNKANSRRRRSGAGAGS